MYMCNHHNDTRSSLVFQEKPRPKVHQRSNLETCQKGPGRVFSPSIFSLSHLLGGLQHNQFVCEGNGKVLEADTNKLIVSLYNSISIEFQSVALQQRSEAGEKYRRHQSPTACKGRRRLRVRCCVGTDTGSWESPFLSCWERVETYWFFLVLHDARREERVLPHKPSFFGAGFLSSHWRQPEL